MLVDREHVYLEVGVKEMGSYEEKQEYKLLMRLVEAAPSRMAA